MNDGFEVKSPSFFIFIFFFLFLDFEDSMVVLTIYFWDLIFDPISA